MASKVDICNRALASIGVKQRIASLTEDTEAARKCALVLDDVIDEVLRAYNWNCATARASLARSASAPAFGYSYKFALPAGPDPPYCLRVVSIEDEDECSDYRIEGRYLLSDETACKILYIKRITDVNELDTLCKSAIAARLAAELAFPMTNSNSLQESMWTLYAGKLQEASEIDAQEGTAGKFESESWIEERL
ncbi:MAG: hypothetical protein WC343_09745 [Bacilli bacterium]|jgi:hypothetical protein